ncbi:MAG: hypothetical protein ABI229_00275 [Gemmatimonadaceae bacterium]
MTSPEASAVGGLYILAQVDGASLPAPPPAPGSSVPCPPAITDGELGLDPPGVERPQLYGIKVYSTRACDPGGIPIDGTPVLTDGGAWSVSGGQISFVSPPSNRKGSYQGSVQAGSPVPAVTVSFAAHTYTFRRLDPSRDRSSSVTAIVVDQQGLRVAGALIIFHSSNGQVLRTYSGATFPPLVADASIGTEVIGVAPPVGYTFAPSQQNPVSATIVTGQMTTVTVVLAKTTP